MNDQRKSERRLRIDKTSVIREYQTPKVSDVAKAVPVIQGSGTNAIESTPVTHAKEVWCGDIVKDVV